MINQEGGFKTPASKSKSEVSHNKNRASFKKIMSYLSALGPKYKPSNPELTLDNLNKSYEDAGAVMAACKASFSNANAAISHRRKVFKPIKRLGTRMVNVLMCSPVSAEAIEDARRAQRIIQGYRMKTAKDEKNLATDEEPIETKVAIQQSYDSLLEHFTSLKIIVTAHSEYGPHEKDLTVASLDRYEIELQLANDEVVKANVALENARIVRDQALYEYRTGLTELGKAAKGYCAQLLGADSKMFKRIDSVRFIRMDW